MTARQLECEGEPGAGGSGKANPWLAADFQTSEKQGMRSECPVPLPYWHVGMA